MYWLNYIFGDLLCKYGTSFTRVLIASTIVIFTSAVVMLKPGSLAYYGEVINPNIFDTLYFSIITFTTLGYGDYHALGAMRFISAIESFFGATLMALFTVIVARQIIRD